MPNHIDLVINLACGVLGGAITLMFSHRLEIMRSRRLAIIAASKLLRIPLLNDRDRPHVSNRQPGIFDIDVLEQALPPMVGKRFRAGYKTYQEARQRPYSEQGPDPSGQVSYTPEQAAAVQAAAAALLKFTEHR